MSTFPTMQGGARGPSGVAASPSSRLGSTSSSPAPSAHQQQQQASSLSSHSGRGTANKAQQPRKVPALIRMPTEEPSDPTVPPTPPVQPNAPAKPATTTTAAAPASVAPPATTSGPILKLRMPTSAAAGPSSIPATNSVTSAYAAAAAPSTSPKKGPTSYAASKPSATPLSAAKIPTANPAWSLSASKSPVVSSKAIGAVPSAPKAFTTPNGFHTVARAVGDSAKSASPQAAVQPSSIGAGFAQANFKPVASPAVQPDKAAPAPSTSGAEQTASKDTGRADLVADMFRVAAVAEKAAMASQQSAARTKAVSPMPARVSTPVSVPQRPASALAAPASDVAGANAAGPSTLAETTAALKASAPAVPKPVSTAPAAASASPAPQPPHSGTSQPPTSDVYMSAIAAPSDASGASKAALHASHLKVTLKPQANEGDSSNLNNNSGSAQGSPTPAATDVPVPQAAAASEAVQSAGQLAKDAPAAAAPNSSDVAAAAPAKESASTSSTMPTAPPVAEASAAKVVESPPAPQAAKPSTSAAPPPRRPSSAGSDMDLDSDDDEGGAAAKAANKANEEGADVPMVDASSQTNAAAAAAASTSGGAPSAPPAASTDAAKTADADANNPPPFRPFRPTLNEHASKAQAADDDGAYSAPAMAGGKRKSGTSEADASPNKALRVERSGATAGSASNGIERIVALPTIASARRKAAGNRRSPALPRRPSVSDDESSVSEESLFEPTQPESSGEHVEVQRRQTRKQLHDAEEHKRKRAELRRPERFGVSISIETIVLPHVSVDAKWCCGAQAWFHPLIGLACQQSALASDGAIKQVDRRLEIRAARKQSQAPPASSDNGEYDTDDSPASSTISPHERPALRSSSGPSARKAVPSAEDMQSTLARLRQSAQKDATVPFKTATLGTGLPLYLRKPAVHVQPARPLRPIAALHFEPQPLDMALRVCQQPSRPAAPFVRTSMPAPPVPAAAAAAAKAAQQLASSSSSRRSAAGASSSPVVPAKRRLEEDADTETAPARANGVVDHRAAKAAQLLAAKAKTTAAAPAPRAPAPAAGAGAANGSLRAELSAELERHNNGGLVDVTQLCDRLEGVVNERIQRALQAAEAERAEERAREAHERAKQDAVWEKRLAALERSTTAAEAQREAEARETAQRCRQLERDLASSEAALRRFGAHAKEQNRFWAGLKELGEKRGLAWQARDAKKGAAVATDAAAEAGSSAGPGESAAEARRRRAQEAKDAELAARLAEADAAPQRPRRAATLRPSNAGPSSAPRSSPAGAHAARDAPNTRSSRRLAETPASVSAASYTEQLEDKIPPETLRRLGIDPSTFRSADDVEAIIARLTGNQR